MTINFEIFFIRQKFRLYFLLYFLVCLSPYIYGGNLLAISLSSNQKISDFCVSNNTIYIVSVDYELYKYKHNKLINKTKILQKVSKRTQTGLINLPNISYYKNNLYVYDSVNQVKVYDKDLNFIKILPIVPLGGFIYIKNDKIIYTTYVNHIGKIYYYDLVRDKNVFVSNSNNKKDLNYRFLTKAIFFKDTYYLYLFSMGEPTKDKVFIFDLKFNSVKKDNSILDIFSKNDNGKLIVNNNTILYEKSIIHWDNKKKERTFKTIFYSYDIKNRKNGEIIKLDNMLVKEFFLENDIVYYLSSIDWIIYNKHLN
jgi:hypothetical protein